METKKQEKISQLRQDIVTGDWVVIATGRAKRPEDFAKQTRIQEESDLDKCFFCYPKETGQKDAVLIYADSDDEWSLQVIPNKYPAFARNGELRHMEEGPYFAMDGVGYHEIIITRDHHQQIALQDNIQVAEIFDAYQDRYVDLMNKKSVNYINIFHNHGKEAGASVAHPHSQLAAIPVISPYIKAELDGAESYYIANRQCAYCTIVEWEIEQVGKKRVIYENENFFAFCPFASRAAFEVWVMPKKHKPYFERISKQEKIEAAEVFRMAISKIYQALKDPPYNFYLHTSPCDGKDYPHYHWHIEILPRTAVWAGFELSTGIEISTIEPEAAAEYLRNIK